MLFDSKMKKRKQKQEESWLKTMSTILQRTRVNHQRSKCCMSLSQRGAQNFDLRAYDWISWGVQVHLGQVYFSSTTGHPTIYHQIHIYSPRPQAHLRYHCALKALMEGGCSLSMLRDEGQTRSRSSGRSHQFSTNPNPIFLQYAFFLL